jgi:hypothetical protein
MKIRISEVWNARGESKELAIIESPGKSSVLAKQVVYKWIDEHRPDLTCACCMSDHGFHAIAIN